jgi:hypothetical protein
LFIFHRQNLDLNKELNDKVAEGRTLGNIGNVNYLLQDYSTSIEYLEKVRKKKNGNHQLFIELI